MNGLFNILLKVHIFKTFNALYLTIKALTLHRDKEEAANQYVIRSLFFCHKTKTDLTLSVRIVKGNIKPIEMKANV